MTQNLELIRLDSQEREEFSPKVIMRSLSRFMNENRYGL
jgi:hypothetical protein